MILILLLTIAGAQTAKPAAPTTEPPGKFRFIFLFYLRNYFGVFFFFLDAGRAYAATSLFFFFFYLCTRIDWCTQAPRFQEAGRLDLGARRELKKKVPRDDGPTAK